MIDLTYWNGFIGVIPEYVVDDKERQQIIISAGTTLGNSKRSRHQLVLVIVKGLN